MTVKDILQFDIYQDAKVVAGQKGLDHVVTTANVISTPNVAKYMRGGELLITGGYVLMDSPNICEKLVVDLVDRGVAVLALRLDAYIEEAPIPMVDACNANDLPLIVLPAHIPYIDLMMPIFEAEINSQYVTLKNSDHIYNTIVDMILSGKNLTDICTLLREIVSHDISVIEKSGAFLTRMETDELTLESFQQDIRTIIAYVHNQPYIFSQVIPLDTLANSNFSYAIPLVTSTGIDGYVLVWNNQVPLSEYAVTLLERASALIALEVMKLNANFETEQHLRGELLDYILFSDAFDTSVARRWASNMNFRFRRIMQVLFFSFHTDRTDSGSPSISHIRDLNHSIKTWVRSDISAFFHRNDIPALITEHDNNLIVLLTYAEASSPRSYCADIDLEKLLETLNSSPKLSANMSVGIGAKVQEIKTLRRSLREAEVAFRIGTSVFREKHVHVFENLGAYSVLRGLQDQSSREFVQSNLGNIMQYDMTRGDLLIDTLEEYFAHDCNYEKTAEALYIHRNTVVYRIKKIEELAGISLVNRTQSFNLQLSLVLYRSSFPTLFKDHGQS